MTVTVLMFMEAVEALSHRLDPDTGRLIVRIGLYTVTVLGFDGPALLIEPRHHRLVLSVGQEAQIIVVGAVHLQILGPGLGPERGFRL